MLVCDEEAVVDVLLVALVALVLLVAPVLVLVVVALLVACVVVPLPVVFDVSVVMLELVTGSSVVGSEEQANDRARTGKQRSERFIPTVKHVGAT